MTPLIARRAALALLVAAPAVAQDEPALLATMRALAAVRTSRARFEESKRIANLEGSLDSAGILVWQAPDRLERRTTEPFEEVLTIEGDRAIYARPAQGVRREFSLSAAPELRPLAEGLRAILAGDLPALRTHFDVAFSGAPESWSLRLTPRALGVRAAVQRVTVSGEGPAIRLVETTGNESTTLRATPLP